MIGFNKDGYRWIATIKYTNHLSILMASLTDDDYEKIMSIMYDEAALGSCNIYGIRGMPICRTWTDLEESEQKMAINGLKGRISTQGLDGYLERKKSENPSANKIYGRTIERLKEEGYL